MSADNSLKNYCIFQVVVHDMSFVTGLTFAWKVWSGDETKVNMTCALVVLRTTASWSNAKNAPTCTYPVLLVPFAAAGVALVAFLSILRLTVATGMINSLILYANIVQVNRKLFFPPGTVNVLTIFSLVEP